MREASLLFAFNRADLNETADRYRDAYTSARPFPHVVMDDFLSPEVLDEVIAEFPSPDAVQWWKFDSPNERKLASFDDSVMGPVTRHLLAELNSSAFVDFLEELTGIKGLVPDPHFHGGGLHQSLSGGYLGVHADFNRHPITGLERRLNLLLYLNRDWEDSYGGALELWDAEMRQCEARVEPVFNRCLIFSTSSISFHGHPHPMTLPDGRTRKSLALYYYTKHRPEGDGPARAHNTLFKPLSQQAPSDPPRPPAWKTFAARWTPPAIADAARSAKHRRAKRKTSR